MSKLDFIPPFEFLGFDIQEIRFKRVGLEQPIEIRLNAPIANYDQAKQIYSLGLELAIEFENSKGSIFRILSGFRVNDEKLFNEENNAVSIFAAVLYPFIRSLVLNVTADGREPVLLPTFDLRPLNVNTGIVFTKNGSNFGEKTKK